MLQMEDKNIQLFRASTWEDVVFLGKKMPQFVFRGQSDQSWQLSTKIERICLSNKYPTVVLKSSETYILREFQRRGHHFIANPPDVDNRLEWLSLLQHYGGPTRLLDFTESIYIAAFFAMESAVKNSAIWALNEEYLWQHTDNVVKENETHYDLEKRGRDVVEKNILGEHSKKVVMMAKPERLNERISVQQGVFVIPGDLNYSFIQNLVETYDVSYKELKKINLLQPTKIKELDSIDCLESQIVKIVLPLEIHNSALYDLDKMNINASTLFPGLEGFARSLGKHLRDAD